MAACSTHSRHSCPSDCAKLRSSSKLASRSVTCRAASSCDHDHARPGSSPDESCVYRLCLLVFAPRRRSFRHFWRFLFRRRTRREPCSAGRFELRAGALAMCRALTSCLRSQSFTTNAVLLYSLPRARSLRHHILRVASQTVWSGTRSSRPRSAPNLKTTPQAMQLLVARAKLQGLGQCCHRTQT